MELHDIETIIEQFKNNDPTADNVQELASLYIVRDHLSESEQDSVEIELSEILPQYKKYCESKRRYQLHEITEEAVVDNMNEVCRELKEFILTLYRCTDFYRERRILLHMFEDLYRTINVEEEGI